MILLVLIKICLYVINGMFLFHMVPKQLGVYVKLLEMLTLPSLAGFCEVLNTVETHLTTTSIKRPPHLRDTFGPERNISLYFMFGFASLMWEDYPFTKMTPSLNDHFWLRPLGGRIREFLLYVSGCQMTY